MKTIGSFMNLLNIFFLWIYTRIGYVVLTFTTNKIIKFFDKERLTQC